MARVVTDFFVVSASADAPAAPAAKVALLMRNLRREVKWGYRARLMNRGQFTRFNEGIQTENWATEALLCREEQ